MTNSIGFLVSALLLGLLMVVNAQNLAKPKISETTFNVQNVSLTTNFEETLRDGNGLHRWPGEECARYCSIDDLPRICYFEFVLEYYHVMGPACEDCAIGNIEDCFRPSCVTADGFERGVMSINRKIPGPPINVCKNDLVVVDVKNHMAGTSATIHWHGIHHRETPFMDGVPFITQCPIHFATSFRYAFNATESGTQFYHSHTGHHKVNGHFGSLIIREPSEDDPSATEYEYDMQEHVILVADWMHDLAEMFQPGLRSHPIAPTNILINGRGQFHDAETKRTTVTPLEVYRVSAGGTYRFRFINSASHICPLQLQIENHRLKIIASDSFPLNPQIVDTLISAAGERYDFVLSADQPPKDNYFIRVRAIGSCTDLKIEQFATLSYADSLIPNHKLSRPIRKFPLFKQTFPSGIYLNHPNTTCGVGARDVCISDLNEDRLITNSQDTIKLLNSEPDHRFVLSFNNYPIPNEIIFHEDNFHHFMNIGGKVTLMGAINNVSFTFPSFSLLTQPELIKEKHSENDIDSLTFCDKNELPPHCNNLSQCPCTHRIRVPLNASVELIVVDETKVIGRINHPFHLHGYAFHVLEMGQHPLDIPLTGKMVNDMVNDGTFTKILGRHGSLSRGFSRPPLKDTISIPSRGFIRIRFRANNPGFWFLHCHFDWHLAIGMGLVIQVGEIDEMKVAPPDFPKCSNYLPNIEINNKEKN